MSDEVCRPSKNDLRDLRLRLRDGRIHDAAYGELAHFTAAMAAADEAIERLQRDLDSWHSAEAQYYGEKNWERPSALIAERDRLRAALEFYAKESNWSDKYDDPPYMIAGRDCGRNAREALAGTAVETRSVQPNPIGTLGGVAAPGKGIPDTASTGACVVSSRLAGDAPDHRRACGAESRHSEGGETTDGVSGNAGALGGSSQFGRWMAIGLALPDKERDGDSVLVICDGAVYHVETDVVNHLWASREVGENCAYSHWMRLPEPPSNAYKKTGDL